MAKTAQSMTDPFGRAGAFGGVLIGVAIVFYAIYTFLPPASSLPYSVTMLIAGVLECAVCYFALHRSRAAWSFALSLNFVAAVVFLFGATKVRDATGLHMAVSLLPSVGFGLVGVLLTMASREYKS